MSPREILRTLLGAALGGLSMLVGISILLWFAYNMIWPTKDFERSYYSIFQLILPILLVWQGWRWLRDLGEGIETVKIPPDAPELAAAIAEARRTLPRFIAAVQNNPGGAYVRFPSVTETEPRKDTWAQVHHYGGGVFNVSLEGSPAVDQEHFEPRRAVPATEVEDWRVVTPEGRIEGYFSLRALFDYAQRTGVRFNRTMRNQRSRLVGAAEQGDEPVKA